MANTYLLLMMNKTFYVLSLLLLSIFYNSYSQHSMQTNLFNATSGDFALVFIDLAQAKDPIFINEKEASMPPVPWKRR